MNILFLCHRFPYPPNRGGKIRPFNMIRHLSVEHSVTVGSLAHTQQEVREGADLQRYCTEVIAEVLPNSVRWLQAWRALFTKVPSSVAYFWSHGLHRRIQEALLRTRFDIILVHCGFVAQYVASFQGGFRILDFGDMDSAKWGAYSEWKPFPISFGYRLEAIKLRKYEEQVAKRFHHCTVTTQRELDEFLTLHVRVPCTVIPNGVDSTFFRRSSQVPSDSPIIVFVGRMDYLPNVDGIVYFASNILPIIRASVPSAELRIIGSHPSRKVRQLTHLPRVSVTGHVPDVRPYLFDATVSVAPLRIARGTQNKILESMIMGIPVVATPEAARGVQAVPGEHLLVANGPEEFARAVVKILQNTTLRQQLAEAGHRQVENTHVWALSMKILDNILRGAPKAVSRLIVHGMKTKRS